MLISLTHQFGLVIFNILAGIITGVLFDIYRVIRGFDYKNKIMTFIQDILFWIFTAIVVFIFLLLNNYAYIGIYVYFWIAVGLLIYLKLLSKRFLSLELKTIYFIGKVFRICKNFIVYPFELLVYNIKIKRNIKNKQK